METVNENSVVTIEYTGKLEDGRVFDTTEGKKPFKVALGKGLIIKGLEKALVGKKEGDEFDVALKSDEAYGPKREGLTQELPKNSLPEKIPREKGVVMQLSYPDGKNVLATIVDVKDDKVKVDLNHPLAGKDLNFHIKVLKVEEQQNQNKEEKKD